MAVCTFSSCKSCFRFNLLVILSMAGVVFGVVLGLIVRYFAGALTKRETMYLGFGGEMFLSTIYSVVLPLVFSSIVSAIGFMNLQTSYVIAIRMIAFHAATTVCAVVAGIVLVTKLSPGKVGNVGAPKPLLPSDVAADILMDFPRNMFSDNLMRSCIGSINTVLIPPINDTDLPIVEWDFETNYNGKLNMIGVVTTAIVFGVAFAKIGRTNNKPLLDFFDVFTLAMFKITQWVIWLAPVGTAFLVAAKVASIDDFDQVVKQVGMYSVTVLIGFLIHALVTLPLLFVLFARSNPFSFMLNMSTALLTAFGTASSIATMPVTVKCLEERVKVDPRMSQVFTPICTALFMNGTAIYQVIAVVFLSQLNNNILDIPELCVIGLVSTVSSIATSGIPNSGAYTLLMILSLLGIPSTNVSLIFIIEWFLDRVQTAVNVLGVSIGIKTVERLSARDLGIFDEDNVSRTSSQSLWLNF